MKPLARDDKGRWISRQATVNASLRTEIEARNAGHTLKEWRDGRIVLVVKARAI